MAFVFLCFVVSLFTIIISPSSSTSITLSLSPTSFPNPSSNSLEFISHISKTTLQRAYHLKHPKKKQPSKSTTFHKTSSSPLNPRSYGGYTVSLAFGTPPQSIPLVFDTGSSLLWVPCTSNYVCTHCTFSHVDPKNITTFIPKLSSSTKIIGCKNKKCGWLFGPDVAGRCSDCGPNLANCSSSCPAYELQYGLGATLGLAISENLDLPGQVVSDFFLGCSLASIQQPEGIAGFGRAPTSLPSQLKLNKFSYCLLSHKFDDTSKSSNLVLSGVGKASRTSKLSGVKYTPFQKNPKISPYNEYYYINLRKITVGRKQAKVKIPYKVLSPNPNGSGGVIVDSGSTLTYMDQPVFEPLLKELVTQLGHIKRAHDIEAQSGFQLCLDVSGVTKVSIPELDFHFKGGAIMKLPVENYFSLFGNLSALCLTIVTDASPVGHTRPNGPSGPAVIIGNYQQQNFYVEYDLEHQRMGFKKQKCG